MLRDEGSCDPRSRGQNYILTKILLVNALRHRSVVFDQSLNELFSLTMTDISHMMI